MLHEDASGKAIMSMQPTFVQKLYWDEFIHPSTSADLSLEAWQQELAAIKRVGYALTQTEGAPGFYTLATAVLNRRGEPLAAMSVSFANNKDVRPHVTPLVQACWQLSARMG